MKTTNTATRKLGLPLRYLTALLAALLVVFSSCLLAGETAPFKGRAEGTVSMLPGSGGPFLKVLAHGHATHLGQFSREEYLLIFGEGGIDFIGTVVFTAANGDQLFGGVVASYTSPTTIAAAYNFAGGTGRFENATGQADALLFTPDGVNFVVEFEGTISSAGNGKKWWPPRTITELLTSIYGRMPEWFEFSVGHRVSTFVGLWRDKTIQQWPDQK